MEMQSTSLNNKRSLRRAIYFVRALVAFLILGAVLTSSTRVWATPLDRAVGSISFNGRVIVNGQDAASGQTLFSKSNIVTSSKSGSMIGLANGARVRVAEQTELTIESSTNRVSIVLSQGHLHCLAPNGILFELRTTDASISISPDESVIFNVTTNECTATTISVEKGQLQIGAAGSERMLIAGETFTTAAASPSFNSRKRIGIWILLGTGVGVLLAAVIGKKPEQPAASPGGCIDILSGESVCH